MSIAIQISSFLIPQQIWECGYKPLFHLPPLAIPVRDALEIERRSRKEVNLRNEARRYSLCCERISGIVRELALGEAPLPKPFVWSVSEKDINPRGVAWLTLAEYLRRFYRIDRSGVTKDTLRYDRLEATFHPPGLRVANLLALLEVVEKNPHLPQVLLDACNKAHISTPVMSVTVAECGAALNARIELLKRCVSESLAMVDLIEIT